VPAGNSEFEIVSSGELIVSDSGTINDADALSVTLTVKLDDPVAVGVPVTLAPARLMPAGNAPLATDHVYGGDPPVALSVCE